jgi:hypothetical protein
MPKKYKSHFVAGLETILNNPQTSFMKNPKVFGELHKQSGMTMSDMIRHIGRGSKNKKIAEPTDDEKSKARLDAMEKK